LIYSIAKEHISQKVGCGEAGPAGMMTYSNEDVLVAFAIEQLLSPGDAWRALVRDLVARWPDAAVFELPYALVSAAAAIEGNFRGKGSAAEAAERGYKLAALLSMDIYAMELAGMARHAARDFQAYWQIDPFFARL
jgi:hypothetical protein